MQRGKKLFKVNVGNETNIHPVFFNKTIAIKILLAENFVSAQGFEP